MLSDAQVERYARQVIVPEIGARGQARLLAARVLVRGGGPLAARIADLLRRAGTTTTDDPHGTDAAVFCGGYDPVASVAPALVAEATGRAATLTVLPGGCCPACAPPARPDAPAIDPLAVCAAHALAALAATETLLLLLDPTRSARRLVLDEETGTFRSERLSLPSCGHGGPTR